MEWLPWDNIIEFAATALGGIATWAWTRWTGKQIEARHRDALHSAIVTGIGYARSKLVGGGAAVDEKQIVNQAKEYVAQSVPDALKYFGLDKASNMLFDMIASKIEGIKLGLIEQA